MKKSGIFIANIVLAAVFGVFLLVSAGVVLVMKGSMDVIEHTYEAMDWNEIYDGGDGYSDYLREVYELPVIENAVAEPLGAEYGGESAYEGYQYYRVTVTVYNGGTEYLFADFLDFDCQGGREGDVYVEYVYEDEWYESDLHYANLPVIPACRTGEVSVILQVKEGVTDLSLILDRTYETGDVQTYSLSLE